VSKRADTLKREQFTQNALAGEGEGAVNAGCLRACQAVHAAGFGLRGSSLRLHVQGLFGGRLEGFGEALGGSGFGTLGAAFGVALGSACGGIEGGGLETGAAFGGAGGESEEGEDGECFHGDARAMSKIGFAVLGSLFASVGEFEGPEEKPVNHFERPGPPRHVELHARRNAVFIELDSTLARASSQPPPTEWPWRGSDRCVFSRLVFYGNGRVVSKNGARSEIEN